MFRALSRWIALVSLVLLVQACSFIESTEQVPWLAVSSVTEADLLDMHFTTAQTGWLVGTKTTILKTEDGGKSWQPAFKDGLKGEPGPDGTPTTLNARFLSLDFTQDGQEGWIVGNPRIVLHTVDAGKSWFAIPLNKKIDGVPILITALGQGVAEMAMNTGFVFKTEDGGKVWRALTPTSAGGARNIVRLKDGSYWAVSVRGASSLSWHPGDREWKLRERTSSRRIQNLIFFGDSQAIMLNNGGELQLTSNGGNTWTKPTTPDIASAAGLLDAALDPKGRLWVTGGSGTLLVSPDLGKTWQKAAIQTKSSLFRVKFSDSGPGFVMGQRGFLLRYQGS